MRNPDQRRAEPDRRGVLSLRCRRRLLEDPAWGRSGTHSGGDHSRPALDAVAAVAEVEFLSSYGRSASRPARPRPAAVAPDAAGGGDRLPPLRKILRIEPVRRGTDRLASQAAATW